MRTRRRVRIYITKLHDYALSASNYLNPSSELIRADSILVARQVMPRVEFAVGVLLSEWRRPLNSVPACRLFPPHPVPVRVPRPSVSG